MKRSSIAFLLGGLLSGFACGYIIQGNSDSTEQTPPITVESPIEPGQPKPGQAREKDLLLQAIHELDLTTAELETATARIERMELKAKRYDWLKNNGIQDHSLSFQRDTFKPSAKLLEFLGLDETDSQVVIGIAETARVAVEEWEAGCAECVEDTSTNCVYEIPPIPENYKQAFIQSLKTVLHPDDVDLLSLSLNNLYSPLQENRKVSLTFVSKEEYTEQQEARRKKSYGTPSDKLKIEVVRFDESGRRRGSSSSTGTIGQSFHFGKRWDHLFTLDNFSE